MGLGCRRESDRAAAAQGTLTGAEPVFEPNVDVQSAGVMTALPALLANGLLKFSTPYLTLPKGFYQLPSILIVLAFTALLRLKSLEGVRYVDPAELGKTIGLDRIPEVKTLRQKVRYISDCGQVEDWGRALAKSWMDDDPDLAGLLYLDGHFRAYYGHGTNLPRHYASRARLCLRGMMDYWVNDGLGQPFFVISKVVDPGLLAVLDHDIVPRLLQDIPNQPTLEELDAQPALPRFGIAFDREGYSPKTFSRMWRTHRIACYTYRKNVTDKLPESAFREHAVPFPNGQVVTMNLSDRRIYHPATNFWFREIRKLSDNDHQTAVICTDFWNKTGSVGAAMFNRWTQENFFGYMMEHYNIDGLIDYGLQETDASISVVNPVWRELERQIKSMNSQLNRKQAEYAVMVMTENIEEDKVMAFVHQKSERKEAIDGLIKKIAAVKKKKKETAKHITFDKLPEGDKFKTLRRQGKQFIDTIKMIAYRAETAMANIILAEIAAHTKPGSSRRDEARAIVRQILATDADMELDIERGILRIKLHNLTNLRNNRYAQQLCQALTDTETIFPGTELRLVYEMVSN